MDVLEKLRREGINWVVLQFMDIKGFIRQVAVRNNLDTDSFKRGIPKLDGSSVEGFTGIEESDLTLKPDPNTYVKIPWKDDIARFIAEVVEKDGSPYPKDTRTVLKKVLNLYREYGYQPYTGVEMEFFVFKDIHIDMRIPQRGLGYRIFSDEAPWNISGYPSAYKKGYYPTTPHDRLFEFRDRLCRILINHFKYEIDAHHHEVAAAGQVELDIRYSDPLRIADGILTIKYAAKNIADQMGYLVTFMPKPLYGDNGSGMHIHISIWRDGKNLFYDPDDEYAELSQLGRYFIGGLIEHGRHISAIVSPTVNSYKRLIPGYEAPVYLVWSKANRSAAIRVPMYIRGDKNKRVEYRPPDPSSNPYLALSAILLAGLDGIKRKIDPGDPIDDDVYKMGLDEIKRRGIKTLPRDLYEAIEELKSDDTFLKPYFTSDLLDTFYELKIREYHEVTQYPTTPELYYYFSI